jgi:hypothetical protein
VLSRERKKKKGKKALLTREAFVWVLSVLFLAIIGDGVFRDGLHLNAWSMRQHPQVLKQASPAQENNKLATGARIQQQYRSHQTDWWSGH